MRRIVFMTMAALFVLSISAGISKADTIEFSGVVDSYVPYTQGLPKIWSADAPYPASFGQTFTGYLSYSAAQPSFTGIGYALNFGSLFSVAPGAPSISSSPDGLTLKLTDKSPKDNGGFDINTFTIQINPSTGTGSVSIADLTGYYRYSMSGTINNVTLVAPIAADPPAPVPEPSTLMMVLLVGPGLAVVAGLKRKTKKG